MLFIGGVVSIFYRVELFCVPLIIYFLLFFVAYVFCRPFDRVVFVNTWQKGGERFRWESVGILFVLFRGSWNWFLKGGEYKNFFVVSNLGGELVYFFFFIFYFILLFICLSFHTCVDVFVECFRKDRYILIKTFYLLLATSRLGVLDWDLWCIWAFYCIWALCCMCVLSRIVKGEIVRFWVCNVGKPWQNMTKTKSY